MIVIHFQENNNIFQTFYFEFLLLLQHNENFKAVLGGFFCLFGLVVFFVWLFFGG